MSRLRDPDEQSREERMAELFGTLRQWSQSYQGPVPRSREQAPAPRRADPGDELAARRERRQQHPRPPRGRS